MARYEYKVVPAPRRATRVQGVKGEEARFAFSIEDALNGPAVDGWEFLRAETLTCEHRGWFRRSVESRELLVFRRSKGQVVGEAPAVPGHGRGPHEPRLAAERGAPRRTSFSSLRASPSAAPDDDRV